MTHLLRREVAIGLLNTNKLNLHLLCGDVVIFHCWGRWLNLLNVHFFLSVHGDCVFSSYLVTCAFMLFAQEIRELYGSMVVSHLNFKVT